MKPQQNAFPSTISTRANDSVSLYPEPKRY